MRIRNGTALCIAAAGLALLAAVVVWRAVVPAGVLEGDEGFHAMWAARIAADIRAVDPLALAYDTFRQVYWPPGFAWLLGVPLAIGAPSDALARTMAVVALAALGFALYAAGRRMADREEDEPVTGLMAVLAGATAGGILTMASRVMLEIPAACLLTAGLWWYIELLRGDRRSSGAWALLGVWIVAAYLMKQNYGVLLALAIGTSFLVERNWKQQRITIAVAAVLLAVWFGYPQKAVQALHSLQNEPWGPARFSREGLFFYPRQMLWLAGTWPLLIIWLAAAAACFAPSGMRDKRVRLLLSLFIWQAIVAELSPTKVDRHIIPIAPAAALLTAACAARLLARPGRTGPRVALALAVAVSVLHVPVVLRAVGPVGRVQPGPLLAKLQEEMRPGGRVLLIGSIDLPVTPAAIDWELLESGSLSPDTAGSLITASEQRFAAGTLPRLPAPIRVRLERLVARWPGDAGNVTLYVGWPLDPALQVRAATLQQAVRDVAGARRIDRIVVALSDLDSREVGVTAALAAARLAELGFAPAGPAIALEGVHVQSFTSGSK